MNIVRTTIYLFTFDLIKIIILLYFHNKNRQKIKLNPIMIISRNQYFERINLQQKNVAI